ncbi:NAD-dependent epimerase/dehydratase family protein [Exiguobacterium antarcticum]|uniref:NAD-dependent epimerase/dehydratase family protein n=1 Tax=Exiguobacterium antarcticum TaxID=132920 RepID=A0ABT6R5Q3_9BACL|nr:NAD-dependent epimerase/dehydratase family protein [Exiguobacterium antarcticum]MDI3236266.1 NAD-dependent epimerase/dehydratase family protein [Exiguobacterium antarcticum]
MKKILVSGENGYIGKSFENTISKYKENYSVDFISVRGEEWEKINFSDYDVFLHLAGKAHVSRSKKLEAEYYNINTNLTIRLAKKAKKDGLKHFIFMSSIIVYGNMYEGINYNTIPIPDNFYGNSKLLAEKKILELADDNFLITILRPPMIYGYKSKGNFDKLKKLSVKNPIFPLINNKRSVLYVENLNKFIKWTIDYEKKGIFILADLNTVSTSEIYNSLRSIKGKRTFLIPLPKVAIKMLSFIAIFRKMFGNLYYENNDCEIQKISLDFDLENAIEKIIISESREDQI